MNYQQLLFRVECDVLTSIMEKLDKQSPIIFYDLKNKTAITATYDNLPIQTFVNKHEELCRYHIIKIYKKNKEYFAEGISNNQKSHQFNLFQEMDTNPTVIIADLLNELT